MRKNSILRACFPVTVLLMASCNSNPKFMQMEPKSSDIFFDDLSYTNLQSFYHNNWKIRTQPGHPGMEGATWSTEGVSFHQVDENEKNTFLRMTSITDGSGENTRHTQICHARKYREGTYAARVYFRDEPTFGPDGDEVIQTFYTISPLKSPMHPDYSEADFEYLGNGGWEEGKAPAIWSVSWETFQLEPWTKVNEYTRTEGSLSGWHTLVLTVADDKLSYYVDGKPIGKHSEKVYPEVAMSINFNLWFMIKSEEEAEGRPYDSTELRQYQQDIDWVFHQSNVALTTKEVEKRVAQFRQNNINFIDEVKEHTPPLPSPCGL
ncbi:glycoside hydrolase family 16 protein [Aliikangiella coralliicola]|uniref:Glycoside hydrolase family 16 protein n=1 Tax=Aliikangiella coralliicola TaxID=2592383 RepID=A0A545UCY7_9GAMM|nr:glycoside hydrolase family 16 protein [Aliikangiella coralliicola]TQV87321.1 glycoside hydrolase family 16 protein [Aliikangiella coralliicola]